MANIHNELNNYQIVPRDLIFDKTLSDRARFVYVFMVCKPDDWNFYLEPMAREIGYSVDTLRKYINELVASGWVVKGSQSNKNGTFGAVKYTIKATKISDTENFRHGNNQPQINKDIKEIKTEIIKEKEEDIVISSKKSKEKFIKPTIQEIQAHILEKGYTFDAEAFYAFYESNGWKVGKNPMKNWKMACTTWAKNRKNNNTNGYGRETITDKIRRTVAEANKFSQQLADSIGNNQQQGNVCDGDSDEVW